MINENAMNEYIRLRARVLHILYLTHTPNAHDCYRKEKAV